MNAPRTAPHSPLLYAGVPVPHGDQFTECYGALAIYEPAFQELLARFRATDPQVHVHLSQAAAKDKEPTEAAMAFELLDGGVAVISISGPMTKFGSSFAPQGSTVRARRAIRQALARDDVSSIVLRIDSPGGTVAGTSDLADDVFEAAKKLPTAAFVEDMGASAAYFVASQAGAVVAGRNSLVGSIGTYTVIEDWSALAAKEGIKVHVVKAGKFKGTGVTGTEVTGEQLADLQRVINELFEPFAAAIGRGRKLSAEKVAELSDGRIHGAAQAQDLGLIDGIGTFDQVVNDLRSNSGKRRRKVTAMSQTNAGEQAAAEVKPQAATIAELKQALPDSTAEFREQCLETGLTLGQAKDAWMVELRKQNAALAKDAAESKAKADQAKAESDAAAAAAKKGAGVKPVAASGGDDTSDLAEQFETEVAALEAKGKKRHEAFATVARRNPEAAVEYERRHNARYGRKAVA